MFGKKVSMLFITIFNSYMHCIQMKIRSFSKVQLMCKTLIFNAGYKARNIRAKKILDISFMLELQVTTFSLKPD